MPAPRIALCHEWITTYGGSDQVAARIAEALDIADVFTYSADPGLTRRLFPNRNVTVISRAGQSRIGRRRWQWFLPMMPRAWRRLDLSRYDMVVTSAHSCVNAIRVPHGRHISYCHTPMRYAWQWREEIGRIPVPLRPFWPAIAALFRAADRRWARRVDLFIANSKNVADRIGALYGKDAIVIYPPIDTHFWTPGDGKPEDFFLCAGRLVSYKRANLVVRAAREAEVRLVVAGNGPELGRLRKLAQGASVEFAVDPDAEQLRDLYRRARALVFAGIEDFGMTLVEAQACGTPVIAHAKGGALEAVVGGQTGLLYEDSSVPALAEILRSFDRDSYRSPVLRRHAEGFGTERFDAEIRSMIHDRA